MRAVSDLSSQDAHQRSTLPRAVPFLRWGGPPVEHGVLRVAAAADITFIEERWATLLRGTKADDANWDWRGKLSDLFAPLGVQHIVAVADDEVQGTLVTTLPLATPHDWYADALYVEYVATAPWNRTELGKGHHGLVRVGPIYKGVGPTLLRHAALRSLAVGRGGRVALHSVPGAVANYTRYGLSPKGPDQEDPKLERFFGDAVWAQTFLAPRGMTP